MKKITINSNEFELTDSSYNFLQSYLIRTKKYIESNGLDIGLYADIEERISEKLYSYQSELGSIDDKDVIATINEIGESEDIFRDYEKNGDSRFETKLKDNLKKSLYKDPSKGVLFGVCQGLGEFFNINPIWFRLFFIATLFFFGTGVVVYLLLAIVLPNKDEDRADIEQNIKGAAEKISEIASRPKIREVGSDIGNGFNKLFSMIGRLISMIFFFLLGMSVMAISIGIILAGSTLRMGLVFDMQDYFHYVPDYAFIFFGIAGISLFAISVTSFAMIFKKGGIISGKVLVGLLMIAGIGIFGMLSSIFETAGNYSGVWTKESSSALSGSALSGSIITLDLDDESSRTRPFSRNISLDFIRSPDSDFHLTVTDSVRAKDKANGDDILKKLNPLAIKDENGLLVITKPSKNDFKDTVPFSFLQREARLYIPADKGIRIKDDGFGNVIIGRMKTISETGEMYDFETRCMGGTIIFHQESDSFICRLPQ